ncbi:hypothetical protein [Actinacidiphila glaucinigra]|uniref:Uncharacterized protein n=1 Tax=Actinacidiphila glaucinigra TaxID=235986 RepID=A0A239EZC4_9ACTN|nr:hypothetical protein [Actinacidiphila glaucinigra]SNS50016.1 hypothetical protein SAMN05216252_106233 [Actinacidiphila glaucinigra]
MIVVICAECSSAPFGATASGRFRCDHCASEITTRDLVLDPGEVWAVDSAGTLGYLPAAA